MDLPQARTTEQRLMVTMCELLGEQNALLVELRDRLSNPDRGGQPATGGEGRAAKLTEPAPPPTTATTAAEPDSPTPDGGEGKKPARKQAAKKTTAAGRRTSKGTT